MNVFIILSVLVIVVVLFY